MKLTEKKEDMLQMEIDRIISELKEMNVGTKDYDEHLKAAKALNDLKEKKERVKPDTWVNAGLNLLLALMVIKHEDLNVITSKAWGFVRGGR